MLQKSARCRNNNIHGLDVVLLFNQVFATDDESGRHIVEICEGSQDLESLDAELPGRYQNQSA